MIEVSHLTKNYGSHTAVSDLSFTIEEGHIYGFLGPNGAGKSTTMNIITGCLAPTAGEVRIGGKDIFEEPNEAKRQIGYLPELPPLYNEQTVREYLEFVGMAKGLRGAKLLEAIAGAADETGVDSVLDRLIGHLSKGYRQRVGIAQALMGDPSVIILDEPTVGLDPAQIIEIRSLIQRLGKTRTVILSSHILSEIQAVCDMVLIIHKGKLVAFDSVDNLGSNLAGGNRIELTAEADEAALRDVLSDVPEIVSLSIEETTDYGCKAIASVGAGDPEEVGRNVFLACVKKQCVLRCLRPVTVTLEDIFLELTHEADAGEQADSTEDSAPADNAEQSSEPEADESDKEDAE